ncbi:hypothetical protein JOQ06_028560, partial [Pogonophryne albipinna]
GPGLHLAEEWINGDVTSPDAKQLRKKIYKHRDSQAHASENASRNDLERQKYKGLFKHLTNSGFVEDLAVMKDILRELQSLSLKLQRREMTLVDSSVHIKQTINVLTAMKTTGGRSTKKAEQGVSSGFFKDVELTEGRGEINKPRFYESVVATLTKRLPESSLVQTLKALDKRFWPGGAGRLDFVWRTRSAP